MKYEDYLKSAQWKQLRKAARERAGEKCEMCKGMPDHVHHVRYPKRFKDDHIDNLVVLCNECHKKSHGIRGEMMEVDINNSTNHEFPGTGTKYPVQSFQVKDKSILAFELEQIMGVIIAEQEASRNISGERFSTTQSVNTFWSRVHSYLDDDEWFDSKGINGKTCKFITEPGLYSLLIRMNTDACKRFRRWVTHEVIPSVRKSGSYTLKPSSDLGKGMLSKLREQAENLAQSWIVLEQHEDQIKVLDARQAGTEERVSQLTETISKWNEINECDLISTAEYLMYAGISDIAESELGRFAAQVAKRHGANRTSDGWRDPKGGILSNLYPAPGTRFNSLNKWRRNFLDWCVKQIRKERPLLDLEK